MRPLLLLCFSLIVNTAYGMAHKVDVQQGIRDVISRYGASTEAQLVNFFKQANVPYPPNDVALLAFKKEREVQLWAKGRDKTWKHVHTYPFTASSGRLGPKLKERDRQIPEGIYRLTSFNPFSAMHLSMMINYPNQFDKQHAIQDGRSRSQLGGNIFIHGKAMSVGCLAVGDKAIEQLFYLTHQVGLDHVKLIISPNDLRRAKPATSLIAQPRWIHELYQNIHQALNAFPLHSKT
jgi:murein L,D-transpeptidase YafK